MTSPAPSDALLAKVQARADAASVPLLELLERVRKRVALLGQDPAQLAGPAMDQLIDEVLLEMRRAAARTLKVTSAPRGGELRTQVGEALDYREDRLKRFSLVLAAAPSLAKALLVLRQAEGLASALRGAVSDQVVTEQTNARRRAAQRRDGMVAMWVPERDACARCLRYAGVRLLRPTDQFPAGLSFDPAQADRAAGTLPGPPLHPHCRCELQLVRKGQSEAASDALRREAERSIAKGWALESEGQASRRRAAAALLERTSLPRSVQLEARKRLGEEDGFTRPVPTGRETAAERAFLRSYSGVYR